MYLFLEILYLVPRNYIRRNTSHSSVRNGDILHFDMLDLWCTEVLRRCTLFDVSPTSQILENLLVPPSCILVGMTEV